MVMQRGKEVRDGVMMLMMWVVTSLLSGVCPLSAGATTSQLRRKLRTETGRSGSLPCLAGCAAAWPRRIAQCAEKVL